MNRGRRGEQIFSKSSDYETFIELLKEAVDLWEVRISAYCLMPNHYHLLIQTPRANISRCMRHINGVYTQRYNRAHKCDGQLFRGRYKAIVVEQDDYLLELVGYMHRNPLRAGLVDSIAQYAWSSHPGYLSGAGEWEWLHKDFILSMLAPDKRKSKQAYLHLMAKGDSEEIIALYEREKPPSMLGSENFITWAKETFFAGKNHKQIPDAVELAPEVEDIIKAVCRFYNVDEKEIFKAKRGTLNEPRNVAIYLSRILRRDSLLQISEYFNMAGYSASGSAIERVRKKLAQDKKFKKKIDSIKLSMFGK